MLKYIDLTIDEFAGHKCLIITLGEQSNKVGIPLFIKELKRLLELHIAKDNIDGVVFIGADFKPALILYWTQYVYKHFKNLKIGWITERNSIPSCINLEKINFIQSPDGMLHNEELLANQK